MSIEKWQKLASRYLVRAPWATLRVDTCRLPDGVVKDDYYVLEYPDWANAVAITRDGKIILVRQYRHAADIISLEIPGGVIEDGETPEAAVKRELLEETGYVFDDCTPLATLYPNPATANNRVFTFLLTGGTRIQEQQLDPHEILEIEEYTMEEAQQLIADNKIAQAMHVAGLQYGMAMLKNMSEST